MFVHNASVFDNFPWDPLAKFHQIVETGKLTGKGVLIFSASASAISLWVNVTAIRLTPYTEMIQLYSTPSTVSCMCHLCFIAM